MSLRLVDEAIAATSAGKPLAPVWLVTGDARLLVDRAVEKLVAYGKKHCGPPSFNLSTHHGSDANASRAFAAARTLPMMADLRVIVIRDIEQGDEAFFEAMAGYCAEPSPSSLVILCGEGFPAAKKGGSNHGVRVQNALKGKGVALKFGAGDVPPAAFAREHAHSLGKQLGGREAELLVELVGADLGRLSQEVEKVALYVGSEPMISAEAIHAACSLLAEAIVWDLTEGIAARKPDLALRSLHRLLEDGDASHRLMGLVVWQLRKVLTVAEMIRAGRPDHEIRDVTRMRGDQFSRLRKALGERLPDPANTMSRLANANRAMNEHRAGDRHVLEALVLELAT